MLQIATFEYGENTGIWPRVSVVPRQYQRLPVIGQILIVIEVNVDPVDIMLEIREIASLGIAAFSGFSPPDLIHSPTVDSGTPLTLPGCQPLSDKTLNVESETLPYL